MLTRNPSSRNVRYAVVAVRFTSFGIVTVRAAERLAAPIAGTPTPPRSRPIETTTTPTDLIAQAWRVTTENTSTCVSAEEDQAGRSGRRRICVLSRRCATLQQRGPNARKDPDPPTCDHQ
jgi:hypothetical protein